MVVKKMKNKSKIAVGLVLLIGLLFVTTIITNISSEEPPEQEGEDPGNGPGPGIYTTIPTETDVYIYEDNQLFLKFETVLPEM